MVRRRLGVAPVTRTAGAVVSGSSPPTALPTGPRATALRLSPSEPSTGQNPPRHVPLFMQLGPPSRPEQRNAACQLPRCREAAPFWLRPRAALLRRHDPRRLDLCRQVALRGEERCPVHTGREHASERRVRLLDRQARGDATPEQAARAVRRLAANRVALRPLGAGQHHRPGRGRGCHVWRAPRCVARLVHALHRARRFHVDEQHGARDGAHETGTAFDLGAAMLSVAVTKRRIP